MTTLEIFLVGLFVVVPHDDGNRVTILMIDAYNRQPRYEGCTLPKHLPFASLIQGTCKQGEEACALKDDFVRAVVGTDGKMIPWTIEIGVWGTKSHGNKRRPRDIGPGLAEFNGKKIKPACLSGVGGCPVIARFEIAAPDVCHVAHHVDHPRFLENFGYKRWSTGKVFETPKQLLGDILTVSFELPNESNSVTLAVKKLENGAPLAGFTLTGGQEVDGKKLIQLVVGNAPYHPANEAEAMASECHARHFWAYYELLVDRRPAHVWRYEPYSRETYVDAKTSGLSHLMSCEEHAQDITEAIPMDHEFLSADEAEVLNCPHTCSRCPYAAY